MMNCNDTTFSNFTAGDVVAKGAEFGAIGASGFFLSYLVVALLFWLKCSVFCLDKSLVVATCECCPAECCEDDSGDENEEDDYEVMNGNSHKEKLLEHDNLASERLVTSQPNKEGAHMDNSNNGHGYAEIEDPQLANNTTTKEGGFGAFLMAVEMVATVPESLVLADSLSSGEIREGLILSIIVLNLVMGFAMNIDLMRPREQTVLSHKNKRVYQLLFLTVTAAAGMVMYSISVEVFFNFTDECANENSLLLITLGTGLGGCLIIFLSWFGHSRYARKMRMQLERCFACCKNPGKSHSYLSKGGSLMSNPFIKGFILMTILGLWLIICTVGGVAIFKNVDASKAFIEGVSGGAFIIAIAGTLIPEAQIAASKAELSGLQKEILSAVAFLIGLVLAVVLEHIDDDH